MSNLGCAESTCTRHENEVSVVVRGRSKDLGGFSVRRVLPAAMARSVGPFVFFDEMGPADFQPGEGINVRPHPHIGLATVTFLFEGEIMHRDSLGYEQPIRPGAVNLMTAGKGIVHSERTADALRESGQRLHGLQVWMALPDSQQEIEPSFVHYPREELPTVTAPGVSTTVIIGSYLGANSPVEVCAETLYLAQALRAGSCVEFHAELDQVAVYVVSGDIRIGDQALAEGEMAILAGQSAEIRAASSSRIMIIGGEDLGPREMYWNFVHSSKERIDQARQDWREKKFAMVPGDEEFIPLPDPISSR